MPPKKVRPKGDCRPRISAELFNEITQNGNLLFDDELKKLLDLVREYKIKRPVNKEFQNEVEKTPAQRSGRRKRSEGGGTIIESEGETSERDEKEEEKEGDKDATKEGAKSEDESTVPPKKRKKSTMEGEGTKKPKSPKPNKNYNSDSDADSYEHLFTLKMNELERTQKKMEAKLTSLQSQNTLLDSENQLMKRLSLRMSGQGLDELGKAELETLLSSQELAYERVKEALAQKLKNQNGTSTSNSQDLTNSTTGIANKDALHDLQQFKESMLCTVCKLREKSVVFMPCQHMLICEPCSEEKKFRTCQYCSKDIECTVEIQT